MLAGRRITCVVCINLGGLFLLAHSLFISAEVHFYNFLHFCLLYNYSFFQFICFRLLSNSTRFYPCF
jgi:hypothetical protein